VKSRDEHLTWAKQCALICFGPLVQYRPKGLELTTLKACQIVGRVVGARHFLVRAAGVRLSPGSSIPRFGLTRGPAFAMDFSSVMAAQRPPLAVVPPSSMHARWSRTIGGNACVTIRSCSLSWPAPGASPPSTRTGRAFGERCVVPRWMVNAEGQEMSPICGNLRTPRSAKRDRCKRCARPGPHL
jgi:hypothetical protein